MKEIKKISVQELDILAQEAASLKGGQTLSHSPMMSKLISIVLLLLHLTKGNPGYTVLSIFKKGIRMVKQNDKNSLGHFAY